MSGYISFMLSAYLWSSTSLFEACLCIPLPGIDRLDMAESKIQYDIPFLPYLMEVSGQQHIQSSYKSNSPAHSLPTSAESVRSDDVKMTPWVRTPSQSVMSTTTENSLDKLLDLLYGNGDWRKTPTSNSRMGSAVGADTTETKTQGFYGNQISVNGKDRDQAVELHSAKPPARVANINTEHSDAVKTGGKLVGNHYVNKPKVNQDGGTDDVVGNVQQMGQLTTSPATMNGSELSPHNNKPSLDKNGGQHNYIAPVNEKISVDKWGDTFMRETMISNSAMFDPEEVNRVQTSFNPGRPFDFITQTGSDPENANRKSSFNADTVNERYMQSSAQHSPPGVTGSDYTDRKEASLYHFGAYTNTETRLFNADALNMRLFAGQRELTGNVPPGLNRAAQPNIEKYDILGNVSQTSVAHINDLAHGEVATEVQAKHTLNKDIPPVTGATKNQNLLAFNFIPGNLFPGQRSSGNADAITIGDNFQAPPFLHNQRSHDISQTFDPNALNAAQSVFNPNSVSWLHKRSSPMPIEQSDHPNQNVDSFDDWSETSDQTSQNSDASTTYRPVTSIPFLKEKSTPRGFDPDTVNMLQGSSFIPGQLMLGSSAYSPRASSDNSSLYDPNDAAAVSMNVDFQSLMGMAKINRSGNSVFSFGNNGFDPSAINAVIANVYNDNKLNTSGRGKLGNSFMSGGFDPNSVNVGFSNVLGSGGQNVSGFTGFGFAMGQMGGNTTNTSSESSFFGFGTGGFDPNAANTGFGAMNYGNNAFGDGKAPPYINSFDANRINQAFMQHPYGQTPNTSDSTGLSGYASGTYGSSFVASFNPSNVNKASFDPSKFNTLHLHFDPVEMLIKNPGIDKDTLKKATFDPDQINMAFTHLAFSPVDMLLANPGIDLKTFSGINYVPPTVKVRLNTTDSINARNKTGSLKPNLQNVDNAATFDPFGLMKNQMQTTGLFKPGTSGKEHINFDPLAMMGQNLSAASAISSSTSDGPSVSTNTTTTVSAATTGTRISATTTSTLSTTTTAAVAGGSLETMTTSPGTLSSAMPSTSYIPGSTATNGLTTQSSTSE